MIKGIGIDLVEIDRFKKVIKRQGKKFLERVFTSSEIKYCLKHKGESSYQHFAVRFAAKEAFLKAIGTGWGTKTSPQWTEIEVRKPVRPGDPRQNESFGLGSGGLPGKPPEIILKGKALQHIRRLKAKRTHLSLTHTQNYASAIIILES